MSKGVLGRSLQQNDLKAKRQARHCPLAWQPLPMKAMEVIRQRHPDGGTQRTVEPWSLIIPGMYNHHFFHNKLRRL
jgi:hypothetical protein